MSSIIRAPPDIHRHDWAYRPEARRVTDITNYGYSDELQDALGFVLRMNPRNRIRGRVLVERLVRALDNWDGDMVLLEPWAMQR